MFCRACEDNASLTKLYVTETKEGEGTGCADVLGRGDSVCQRPELGAGFLCVRNSKEASAAREGVVTGSTRP